MKSMKKYLFAGLILAVSVLISSGLAGCSKKSGCPMNETVQAKTNKRGEYSTKRGRSNLFPKDMRKKN